MFLNLWKGQLGRVAWLLMLTVVLSWLNTYMWQHDSNHFKLVSMAAAAPKAAEANAWTRPRYSLPNFVHLVEKEGPAVVHISVVSTVASGPEAAQNFIPDPALEFFRRFDIPLPPSLSQNAPRRRERREERGVGSGFIISKGGYILTNAHVVERSDKIIVTLADKRQFQARLIGSDRRTDVALLKVEGQDLPVVTIGQSSRVRVGEWVAAIGSPFGFDSTVTAGIISARSRSLPDEAYVPFLQTDVAVNPGNSGGPLFNLSGEVIGINSQIYSRSGGYQGISFAIPIDVAMNVKDQLLKHGQVRRGRIGVSIQEITADLAKSFGLAGTRGALVSDVEVGGPADRGGIRPGDIVVSVNGEAVPSSLELPRIIAELPPGSVARVGIIRAGGRKQVKVILDELPSEQATARAIPSGPKQDSIAQTSPLGVRVRPLSTREKQEMRVATGVLIEAVAPGSVAEQAGLRSGYVILALNNMGVESQKELDKLLQDKREVALLVRHPDGRTLYIPVSVD